MTYHPDKFRRDLRQWEGYGYLGVIEETEENILTDDYDELRLINYHLVPPTPEWLASLIVFCTDASEWRDRYEKSIVDCLMRTDRNMLITLRRIYVIGSAGDVEEMAKNAAADNNTDDAYCMIPDELQVDTDEELANTSIVGMYWNWASALIINKSAVDKASDELCDELGYRDAAIESEGVLVTLLHELRHLALTNPFEPLATCSEDTAEEAVEEWARAEYERLYEQ